LAEAQAHPTRVFANALTNACWRNGPVEGIHAGRLTVLPLTQRRITKREERLLIRVTAERLVHGLLAAFELTQMEESERTWAERVLPYHLSPGLLIAPSGWTLNERTRTVRLFGAEPYEIE
jgi:hypothetical protein